MEIDELTFDGDGLIPAVIQDHMTGQVRMVGWMNRAAIEASLSTGLVHFWSRRRSASWRKGETSGNSLQVVDIVADCDADTLLVTAEAVGPTCHTGATSCFETDDPEGFAWLDRLSRTVRNRMERRPAGSYTAALAAAGVDGPARKVLEEAGELVFAAKNHASGTSNETYGPQDRTELATRLVEEAADLLYHTLVLLHEREIDPADVIAELRKRHR